MRRILFTLPLIAALLAVLATPILAAPLPDQIDLPNGFAPEGIATGRGSTFFSGSLAGAGIWRGDYRTGEGALLVEGGGPFVGMKVDAQNRLWVAGGDAGSGYVFDAANGELLASFDFAEAPTFINDVVVTHDAAYFTDSFRPALYRVPIGPGGQIGEAETIPLDPEQIGFSEGAFNLNGIDATPDGQRLVAVNSTAGELYAIDPTTGAATLIDLGEAASVTNGDGILLSGQTLYVVRNFDNLVAVVQLAPDLTSGTYLTDLKSGGFWVPTTVARFGSSLFVVNARFDLPVTPDTEYWITRVDRFAA
jgi:sugar lactone lactonase YvrE